MSLTVGIVAGSISGNKGAEAMVSTVIGTLTKRLGDVRFVIFSPYFKLDRDKAGRYPNAEVVDGGPVALVTKIFPATLLDCLIGWTGVRPVKLSKAAERIARCDLVVDVAGISFADGREKYLPFNVLTILPPMMLGIDVVKMSQACGPFRHRVNRAFARWLLPKCRCLFARGAGTIENLRSIGMNATGECPDVALMLNELEDMHNRDERLEKYLQFGTPTRKIVGLSPSSVVHSNCANSGLDYIGVHAEFVRYLVDSGYRVLILPHSWRQGKALKNNDLPVARQLVAAVGETHEVSMVVEELDSISLRKLTGGCDLFVASRFHSMIGALAMAVPVMVCGWGHKYFEILDMFGMRDFAFDYRELSASRMVETFDRLAERSGELRERIAEALPGVMQKTRVQIDAIADILKGMQDGQRNAHSEKI